MEPGLKKILKSLTLELRHLLEGRYDAAGAWLPGDLEQRLAAIGVRRDRVSVLVDELPHLSTEDRQARRVVDAYLKLREDAGVGRTEAVAEFVRETAYTWANRLFALRCMEARELIDPVILQQQAYGGRSLEHHRLAQRRPELCAGEDDGLFSVLDKVFREQMKRLPMLFDPQAAGIALRPSPAAIKDCFGLLSLHADTLRKYRIRLKEDENAGVDAEPPNPFVAPDALGWAYQYWNAEEKDRVVEKVRTVTGAKIAGADIVPATQLYTEDYMVKFLVQNSLGATWMGMHPDSKLCAGWEYYVIDADRAPVEKKAIQNVTFLDPACGSGHFLLEAFDLFYAMYEKEGELKKPEDICTAILTKNLFGIDIDARSVQIAEAALWMKAAERAFDFEGAATNLVAATSSHLRGLAWEEFLASFQREPSVARVLCKFAETMEHVDEIGSLARPAYDLREIIKEEHVVWERQIREEKESNFLFPEMRKDALSGQLPFHEITDEEFGERLLYRVRAGMDAFTQRAREMGEFNDQMLARETQAGFRLVDMLSQQYDVVAANPPYLGSQSMGPVLQTYVEHTWRSAKRDLYAAFIARCLELSKNGRMALVTQQAWLFLKQMHSLRDLVLPNVSVETLGHLGPGAFEEISGAHVNVVLFVASVTGERRGHILTAIRPGWMIGPASLARQLAQAARKSSPTIRFRVYQQDLLVLPNKPLVYWCPQHFLNVLKSERTLDQTAEVTYTASANSRFVRHIWETPANSRWRRYSKGGGFKKWEGLNISTVYWGDRGERISAHVQDKYPPDKYSLWIKQPPSTAECVVWSEIGSGSMGARRCDVGSVISRTGPGVFSREESDLKHHLLILNSRVATYLLRLTCSGLHFAYPYVAKLPYPKIASSDAIVDMALLASCYLCAFSVLEGESDADFVARGVPWHPADATGGACRWSVEALLHSAEALLEQYAIRAFDVSEGDAATVFADTGRPSGCYPLVQGFDQLPEWPRSMGVIPTAIVDYVTACPRVPINERTRAAVRVLCESGAASDIEDDDEPTSDVEDEVEIGARLPVPATTFIDHLSQRLELHPISVYWIVRDGINKAGWRCLPEERRHWADKITVVIIRLLGHRYPKHIEIDKPISDWADSDGIIPLTPLAKEKTLFERVQRLLSAEGIVFDSFREVMGKPLDAWLTSEFFKHHVRQFKKRPIAWQMQSGSFSGLRSPAFACLVYYQRLDADALPKLRAQYVGPLRQRMETELRGITSIAAKARSDRQEKRHIELEYAIGELQTFDTILATVTSTGFGPTVLLPTLRQFAVDDAILSLKACWLRRVSEFVSKSSLSDWSKAADRSDLHPDLGFWISEAILHLDHGCSQVGPKSLDQRTMRTDAGAAELAEWIACQSASMIWDSLKLACDVWWKPLDEAVFAPIKEQLKALRAEQKECEEVLKTDPPPPTLEASDLKRRLRQVKAEVKELNQDLKEKTALATQVRELIESWRSDEPLSWGDWLAGQPLYDQVSSLDQRRPAPTTIAEFITQESLYAPDINDGVRVNIAPLQKAGLLAADVLAAKDVDKAIADRAEWRADERRWVREGKLPQPGWWPE